MDSLSVAVPRGSSKLEFSCYGYSRLNDYWYRCSSKPWQDFPIIAISKVTGTKHVSYTAN